MPDKTDRNDARALARQCRLWRSLLVARRAVLNEMRSIENGVRAVLRESGVKLGTPSRAGFAGRVRELAGDDALVMTPVGPLLTMLATMLDQLARLTKQVLDIVRSKKWPSLRAWGIKIAKHRGMARARVAVARKLAVILHRLWSDQTAFRFGKDPCAAAAPAAAVRRSATDHELVQEGEPDRSRGDDGPGDLVESPEPAGCKPARS